MRLRIEILFFRYKSPNILQVSLLISAVTECRKIEQATIDYSCLWYSCIVEKWIISNVLPSSILYGLTYYLRSVAYSANLPPI